MLNTKGRFVLLVGCLEDDEFTYGWDHFRAAFDLYEDARREVDIVVKGSKGTQYQVTWVQIIDTQEGLETYSGSYPVEDKE